MNESNIETRTHTALHVVKGAAQRVLATDVTTGVYVQGADGRLTVRCAKKPMDEEMKRVEGESNRCISENREVRVLELERSDADRQFGSAIYDAFPVPAHVTTLKIVHIDRWNINCCNKEHTNTTGEIGSIAIDKFRFRAAKQGLEISFRVGS